MSMDNTTRSSGIIWDGAILSGENADIIPLGREKQKESLRGCLAPMLKGEPPLNAWVYGPPGTGKTLLARHLVAVVCANGNRVGVLVNCWQHRTLYRVLQAITDQLKVLGSEAQETDVKFDRIRQALRGGPVVVILDDVDRPMPHQRQEIIRGLLGLPKIGLICTAKSTRALSTLDESTRSRLSPVPIKMPAYSAKDTENILTDRARRGLAPDAWSPAVIKRLASAAGGDARVGIQLLRQSAAVAEEKGRTRIDLRSVDRLSRQWQAIRAEGQFPGIRDHERIMLELARKHAPVGVAELARLYVEHCRSRDIAPVAGRTFSKYLNRLTSAGVLETRDRSRGIAGRIVKAA
jgi:Cdc6-like AAA superfamily ATPase